MSDTIRDEDGNWDLVLKPHDKLLNLKLRELARYRDLVWLFIKRDFTTVYTQTILGPLWFILNPLVSTIMYNFVFGNLAKIGTDGVPGLLFYYGGTMLWTYFTGCLNDGANVFSGNAGLFGKVYFPRLAVPVSRVFSNLITTAIQFATLMVFFAYFLFRGAPIRPSWAVLAFPLLLAWIAMLGMGIGMVISAVTTKYKDLKQLVGFGLSLAMYATPIVYPLSEAPRDFLWVFYVNPMSAPVELFRVWFYGAGHVPASMTIGSLATTMVVFFLGLVLFNRNERTFVDMI